MIHVSEQDTTSLSATERHVLKDAVLSALPWRKNHIGSILMERYEMVEQSLILQIEHNDLQLPVQQTDSERIEFMKEVIVPRIVQQTLRCMAQPGTPVGMESATATGRLSTQMNLNSFHSSGQLHAEVLQGVPRLNELFNATRDMKHPMMVIRFHPRDTWMDKHNSINPIPGFENFHAFKQFTRHLFEHKTLLDVIDLHNKPYILYEPETFPGLPTPEPYWYAPWRHIYGEMRAITMKETEPASMWNTIRIKLDKRKMVLHQLSTSYIAQVIQESVLWAKTKKRLGSWTPIIQVVFSPDYEAVLDLHVRVDHMPPLERIYRKAHIQQSRQGQILLDESNRRQLFLSQVMMNDLCAIRLCGIPNIHEINWRSRGDKDCLKRKKWWDNETKRRTEWNEARTDNKMELLPPLYPHETWEVITRGSAFRDVSIRPEVDLSTLYTNNPFEVLEVLGIEAARQVYLKELRACMGSVDESLFHTAIDSMTHRGTIMPANRFGSNPNDGPLTRASNEMSTQTLLRAANTHQRDNLNGVSSSVMIGKPVPIGTGLPELGFDADLWLDLVEQSGKEESKKTVQIEVVPPPTRSSSSTGIDSLISKLSMVTPYTYSSSDMEEV
jgi:hypothetical protein